MVVVTSAEESVAVGASKVQALVHSTVLFATQLMVGGVWSSTVTVWLHSAVLPQASVACHVRVAAKVLPQWPTVLVTVLRMEMVTVPQVSLAVGGSKSQTLVHSKIGRASWRESGGVWAVTVAV